MEGGRRREKEGIKGKEKLRWTKGCRVAGKRKGRTLFSLVYSKRGSIVDRTSYLLGGQVIR